MNSVVLVGRVTKDIEERRTQKGTPVVSFTLAVDRRKKEILDSMQKYGVLKIDNDFLKIAFIPEHDTEKFDSKTFKEENPDVYDLYAKISKVKPSIRITVK